MLNLSDFTKSQIATLCPELISENMFEQLLALSELLPTTLFSQILSFEFVAHETEGHTDFGFMLSLKKHSAQEIIEGFNAVSSVFRENKHWVNFFRFLKEFEKNEGNLKSDVSSDFCLVFDFHPSWQGKNHWPPDPNFYFSFHLGKDVRQIEFLRNFFAEKEMSPTFLCLLRKCCASCLSLNLKVANIGILPARSLDSMRLYVEGETVNQIQDYLVDIGYPYETRSLFATLKIFSPYFEKFCLGIDLGESIHDRIGIECHVPSALAHPERMRLWNRVLSLLCEKKMLSLDKKASMLNWIRFQMVRADESSSEHLLFRAVNHLKLLYNRNGIITAKVYLMPKFLLGI